MLLIKAASACHKPGARTRLRPAFPNVPAAGVANAAGLIQCPGVCPSGGVNETPGTRSGRSDPDTLYWSGTTEFERLITTFTGRPLRTVATPLNCQPPRIARPTPGFARCRFPAPNGNS